VNIGIGSIRSTAVKAALGAILALGLLAGPAFATTLSVTPSIQGSGRVADAAAPYSCTFAAVHNTDVNSTPCATSAGYAGSRLSCTISRICLIIPLNQLNLTATPATGWEFTGWSGTGCSGTNPVCAMSVFALASDPASQSFAPRAIFREIVNTDVTSPTVSNGGITNHPDVTLNYSSFLGTSFICSLDGVGKTCAIQPDHSGSSTFTGLADGSHTFTISAKNAAGNIGDAKTPPVVTGSPSQIQVVLAFGFKASKHATRFTKLQVKNVPFGATVHVTCHGRGCPKGLKGKGFTKKRAFGTVDLKKFVRKPLRPGTAITAVVSKPGAINAVKVLKIRAAKAPTVATRCQPPGAKKPVSC
jgi:hypothetical protein